MGFLLPADATFRRLTWQDFKTVTMPAPPPGSSAEGAHTEVNRSLQPNTFNFKRAEFLKPPNFKMVEDPSVIVTLDTSKMWVASWVSSRPQAFQDALLNHEQGHYEISMLNSKDVFFELLDISGGAFSTAKDGIDAVKDMQKRLFSAQAIHDKYDVDTNGGLNAAMQTAWDAALLNARVTFVHPSLRTALKNAGLFP